jgi:hypothetical protein
MPLAAYAAVKIRAHNLNYEISQPHVRRAIGDLIRLDHVYNENVGSLGNEGAALAAVSTTDQACKHTKDFGKPDVSRDVHAIFAAKYAFRQAQVR